MQEGGAAELADYSRVLDRPGQQSRAAQEQCPLPSVLPRTLVLMLRLCSDAEVPSLCRRLLSAAEVHRCRRSA